MDKIQFYSITRKSFFWKEWFEKGIRTIKDLLDENGNVLSFPVFQSKYSLQKTTSLHFYQVICAVPGNLLTKAKTNDLSAEIINNEDPESFHLDENVVINLLRAKSKNFYWLIVDKKYKEQQTGAKRWNQTVPMDKTK